MTFGNLSTLPFKSCDATELNCINDTDRYFKNDDSIKHHNFESNVIQQAPNPCDYDIDIKLSNLTDCDYYSVDNFQNLNLDKSFNIFHSNINGLESKFDLLHNFFSSTEFDIIAINEISLQTNNEFFKTNVNLDGYLKFSSPTNTSKGGTTIFTNMKYDAIERQDLNVINDHYETIWTKLKNKQVKQAWSPAPK